MRKHDDNLTVAIRRSRHEGWMEFLMPKCHEDVNRFTQKMLNSILNIEYIIWPDGFILDWTHELSTRI